MPNDHRKNIDDLRAALFATLDGLKDGTVSIDQARAINEVGKTIVDTAKVEIDFLRATDGTKSEFLTAPASDTTGSSGTALPKGITGITTHRIAG